MREISSEDDHGSAIWTPAFHCTDFESGESYWMIAMIGAPWVVKPPLFSVCSVP